MQVSRHWRLRKQTYRLQGIRYDNGDSAFIARPTVIDSEEINHHNQTIREDATKPVSTTASEIVAA